MLKVPSSLLETQTWFASVIGKPLVLGENIAEIAPSGSPIQTEAARFIVKNEAQAPHERIEIYNQQYWWRLLNLLQEIYPTLTAFFTPAVLNDKILVPYLQSIRLTHWSVNVIGDKLPSFLFKNYREKDRRLILHAAKLDLAFHSIFFERAFPFSCESEKNSICSPMHGFLNSPLISLAFAAIFCKTTLAFTKKTLSLNLITELSTSFFRKKKNIWRGVSWMLVNTRS